VAPGQGSLRFLSFRLSKGLFIERGLCPGNERKPTAHLLLEADNRNDYLVCERYLGSAFYFQFSAFPHPHPNGVLHINPMVATVRHPPSLPLQNRPKNAFDLKAVAPPAGFSIGLILLPNISVRTLCRIAPGFRLLHQHGGFSRALARISPCIGPKKPPCSTAGPLAIYLCLLC
jgi:hypothetical protein